MKCNNCDYEIDSKFKFCPSCGEKVELVCRSCGSKLVENAKFCFECGTPVSEVKVKEQVLNVKAEELGIAKSEKAVIKETFTSEVNVDWFGNDKSVYSMGYSLCDHNRIAYQGKVYFINKSNDEIWMMDEETGDQAILLIKAEDDHNPHIAVNRRGIFTYSSRSEYVGGEEKYVYQYSFAGELIKKIDLKRKRDYVEHVFFYDNLIYFVDVKYTIKDIGEYEEYFYKGLICSVDILTDEKQELYQGDRKEEIKRILVCESGLLFYSFYKYNDQYSDQGWNLLNLTNLEAVNINSVQLPAQEVLKYSKKYEIDSRRYVEVTDRCEIFAFDLIDCNMWTTLSKDELKNRNNNDDREKVYVRSIGIAPKERILTDYEDWKINGFEGSRTSGIKLNGYRDPLYLFNGDVLYYAIDYYTFIAIKDDGTCSKSWASMHGRTETMQITGNSLIGDLHADYYDVRYPLAFDYPKSKDTYQCEWETPVVLDENYVERYKEKGRDFLNNKAKACYIDKDFTIEDMDYVYKELKMGLWFANNVMISEDNSYFVVKDDLLMDRKEEILYRVMVNDYSQKVEVVLPETIKIIKEGTFVMNNNKMGRLVIPKSIEVIEEDNRFYNIKVIECSEDTIAGQFFKPYASVTRNGETVELKDVKEHNCISVEYC